MSSKPISTYPLLAPAQKDSFIAEAKDRDSVRRSRKAREFKPEFLKQLISDFPTKMGLEALKNRNVRWLMSLGHSERYLDCRHLPHILQDYIHAEKVTVHPALTTGEVKSCHVLCGRGKSALGIVVLGMFHWSSIPDAPAALELLRDDMRSAGAVGLITVDVVGGSYPSTENAASDLKFGNGGKDDDYTSLARDLLVAKVDGIEIASALTALTRGIGGPDPDEWLESIAVALDSSGVLNMSEDVPEATLLLGEEHWGTIWDDVSDDDNDDALRDAGDLKGGGHSRSTSNSGDDAHSDSGDLKEESDSESSSSS
jgi:hypothetical protein